MTEGEMAYLALVVGGMITFMLVLGFVTWDENRSRPNRQR